MVLPHGEDDLGEQEPMPLLDQMPTMPMFLSCHTAPALTCGFDLVDLQLQLRWEALEFHLP